MTGPVRIAAFAATCAAAFGGAVAVGAALDPEPRGRDDARQPAMAGHGAQKADEHGATPKPTRAGGHGGDGHGAGGHATGAGTDAEAAGGLAIAQDGLRLVPATATLTAGRPQDYAFRIADRRGATVRDFDVEHDKRLHLIAVRRDLSGFQHVHPEQASDGTWRQRLRLPEPGAYRVFADFSTDGRPATLAADLTAPGDYRPRALPAPADHASADGFDVSLHGHDGTLAFRVTRGGAPVDVEPYLGADGHLVALREGDLAFLHVHPEDGAEPSEIAFAARYPSAGRYRLFLQFKVDGRVHTAAFTQEAR